jgi:predicted nucleotidyltransferase
MGVFGFREALAATEQALLPIDASIRLVSLASLTLLKIVAWDERHYRVPRKDAEDLASIIRHFLRVGNNTSRLLNQFWHWTQDESFDIEESGARLLGHDIR